MKVKTDYSECEYITAGKVYEVDEDEYIIDDDGSRICIMTPSWNTVCPHLDDKGFWEEVKE